MNILYKGIFGSRLYETHGETSDYDYKGIFTPTIQECILGGYARNINIKTNDVKNVKNSAEDSDTELYALQEFIKLALQGQTVAIDILSSPKDKILISSPQWDILQSNKKRFYTKSMNSFLGYSRAIGLKYGQRAEKLNSFKDILSFLSLYNEDLLISDIWGSLPENQFYKKIVDDNGRRFFEINGKKMQEFASIKFVVELINIQISDYGKRVREAANNENFDFKGTSHAFRVAYELKQILETGDLVFPLQETEFIKQVKYGQLNFINDKLGEKLENLIDEVGDLIHSSNLPEKPDKKWADSFILACYNKDI